MNIIEEIHQVNGLWDNDMVNREDLKQTTGYKRLLSMGAKDDSGPRQQKTGAFLFHRYNLKTGVKNDYADYKITNKGDVKRQSAGPAFDLGYVNMDSLSSYNEAFNDIANKMDQILTKENRAKEIEKEKQTFNKELLYNIINGKPVMTSIKYKNFIKRIFSGKMKPVEKRVMGVEYEWNGEIDWGVKRFLDNISVVDIDAVKRMYQIPGAVGLFHLLKK